jgi:hypothetical protein
VALLDDRIDDVDRHYDDNNLNYGPGNNKKEMVKLSISTENVFLTTISTRKGRIIKIYCSTLQLRVQITVKYYNKF